MKTENELNEELNSFGTIWPNGFYPGNRAHSWNKLVGMQPLFAKILKKCIKPYVNENTDVLEIGCGGGFYTQHFLHARKIRCFDALSAEHNKFWESIKRRDNVKYFHVNNFLCEELEDNSVDYLFSYNVFVHISYTGVDSYLKNLHRKLRSGADCFIQIIDIKPGHVYNEKKESKMMVKSGFKPSQLKEFLADYDGEARMPGRLYLYGVDRFCGILEKYNYKIVSRDFLDSFTEDAFPSAPVIHFRKE